MLQVEFLGKEVMRLSFVDVKEPANQDVDCSRPSRLWTGVNRA
jgi:hypothetical protein